MEGRREGEERGGGDNVKDERQKMYVYIYSA